MAGLWRSVGGTRWRATFGAALLLAGVLASRDALAQDQDGDGVPDASDNCPTAWNPGQWNSDSDSHGNACDNCWFDSNEDQADVDGDGWGDACDFCIGPDNFSNNDGDAWCNSTDNCPNVPNDSQTDTDGDGVGNACDPCPLDDPDDTDGDGICDSADICPGGDDNDDADLDGNPDYCDPCPEDNPDDTDGDGVCDTDDICPGGDDNEDTDGDGVPDHCDPCPDDTSPDTDGDGYCDLQDNCPTVSNGDQADLDEDGLGDACDPDADGDGVNAADGDCDDFDDTVYPGATEVCDGVDQDCDGVADDGVLTTWYLDTDGDGWGQDTTAVEACDPPSANHVDQGGDCDEVDADVNPGAEEVCNGVDDDCNGVDDDGAPPLDWYPDLDGDGYGDSSEDPVSACPGGPTDVLNALDCDDSDADVNPDAVELCDGIDNDCDGETDEDDAVDVLTWYEDADGDGFGTADSTTGACEEPDGYVDNDIDCDDGNAFVHPGAFEQCDGIDNDCDPATDDSELEVDWYPDLDGDGFGDQNGTPESSCLAPGEDWIDNPQDCDDTRAEVNPEAEEVCDGIDNDCDGSVDGADAVDAVGWYEDLDGDGWGGDDVWGCDPPADAPETGGDCDDTNADVNPGAEEIPGNGIDDDCDGSDLPAVSSRVPPDDWQEDEDLPSGCSCATPGGPGVGVLVLLACATVCRRRKHRLR